MEDSTVENCSLAINRFVHGQGTFMALHQDAKVAGACIVSAMSLFNNQAMYSSTKNYGAVAGELFHEIGGLIYGYGENDVILFNGKHFHAPKMPRPKDGTNVAGRVSFVLFRNIPESTLSGLLQNEPVR